MITDLHHNLYHYTGGRPADGGVQGAGQCLHGTTGRKVQGVTYTLENKLSNHKRQRLHLKYVFRMCSQSSRIT